MKIKLLIVLFMTCCSVASKAQDSVSIFMNGVLAGQYNIKKNQTDSGGIWYKKSVYKKKMDELSIQVRGKNISGWKYLRTINVTDDEGKSIYIAAETQGIMGQFNIDSKDVLKRLSKGKPVKFFLLLEPTPANPKLTAKKLYMGRLYAK